MRAVPGMLVRLALLAAATPVLAQSPPTIVKSFGAATVGLNSSVTLTFTLTNPNPATDLTGVSFNDNLPAGLIIANPDSLFGSCDPGVITPSVTSISMVGGTVLAGGACSFSVDVLAIAKGDQVNTTDPVTSNEGGTGGTATATVTVVLPDLAITKTHTGNFTQGQKGAAYTITVTNVGGGMTQDVVAVMDAVPAGLTPTGVAGTNWFCTQPSGPCTRVDALNPGDSYEPIILTVDVAIDAPASVTNTATVSGGGQTAGPNDTATDPTVIAGADFHALGPCRAIDTRQPAGPYGGPALSAGEVRAFPIPTAGCSVPATARAVVVNLTAVNPAAAGVFQIWPSDQPVPATSSVAFDAGKTRAAVAIVSFPADGTGRISVHNVSTGPVDVLLDVSGYFE